MCLLLFQLLLVEDMAVRINIVVAHCFAVVKYSLSFPDRNVLLLFCDSIHFMK